MIAGKDWVQEHLPAFFHIEAWRGVAVWQLLAFPIAVALAYLLARIAVGLLNPLIARLTRVTKFSWDDLLVDRMRSPLRLLVTGLIVSAMLPFLDLHIEAVRVLLLLAGFWALLRAVDIAHASVKNSPWLIARPATVPIFSLLSRFVKIIVVALAAVTTLQQLGYPVAGLIAGLGVGGLAVALAAQKTLEHLLGSVMLSVDQPLQVGALVKVGDVTGFVEQIGLRSTRIRSLQRTIVTIPNGKLADSQIENISARDRQQFQIVLTLRYDTKVEQLRRILAAIKKHLQEQPRFVKEESFAHLRDLGDTGFVIEINGWLKNEGTEDLRDVRQDALVGILAIVEAHESALATRTLFFESAGKAAEEG